MNSNNKKIMFIGLLCMLSISSCSLNFPYYKYEKKTDKVNIKYNQNKIYKEIPEELEGYKGSYYDKSNDSKKVSTLLGGDELDIYYDNDTVKRVLVNKAKIIKIKYDCDDECEDYSVCSCDKIKIIPYGNDNKISLNGITFPYSTISFSGYQYVISKDETYKKINKYSKDYIFYATYNEYDFGLDKKSKSYVDINISIDLWAIYDYRPR